MIFYRLATATLWFLGLLLWLVKSPWAALAGRPLPLPERLMPPPVTGEATFWLHGASNGELTAARPLIDRLLTLWPDATLLITANNPTACTLVTSWGLPRTSTCLAPLDSGFPTRAFLHSVRPRALIIIENELWLVRLAECAARNIPVLVAGARMSDRSARRWQHLPGLIRPALASLAWLAPQDEASRDRFLALGLPPDRPGPILSLKSTIVTGPATDQAPALPWSRPLTCLAASTHEGEEAAVLDAFLATRSRHHGLGLILAPRHPRRRDEIEAEIARRGLPFATRSRGQTLDGATRVYLADTLGEMALWYRAAGICFVGGSLTDRGGHTPFEPSAHGCAILHGPHVGNFTPAYQALRTAGGAIETRDSAALAATLAQLAGDGAEQNRLARAAAPALARLQPADGLQPFFTALCAALER